MDTKYSKTIAEEICRITTEGMGKAEAARTVDVSRYTVATWTKKYSEFRLALSEAQKKVNRNAPSRGIKSVRARGVTRAYAHLKINWQCDGDLNIGAIKRPRYRSECLEMPRPCPFVACRYHFFLDVNPKSGSIKFNFNGRDLTELEETCALDVVERAEELSNARIRKMLNVSGEAIRQIILKSLAKFQEMDP